MRRASGRPTRKWARASSLASLLTERAAGLVQPDSHYVQGECAVLGGGGGFTVEMYDLPAFCGDLCDQRRSLAAWDVARRPGGGMRGTIS